MSDDSTTFPWEGNYNPRGASLTFTNKDNIPHVYYSCFLDFPSSFQWQDSDTLTPFSYVNVTNIKYPGTFDYNTNTQYLAINRDLVYYNNCYYYCIADTMGDFKPESWLSAGANSFQLNFSFMDEGNDWPGGNPGADTIVTWPMPIFRTDPNYNPADGPIVSFSITNETSSTPIIGNPNAKRPPIVNLPLKANPGVPMFVIVNSLTQPIFNEIITCVNTGTEGGFENNFGMNGAGTAPDGMGIFNAALEAKDKGAVAATGSFIINFPTDDNFGVTIGSNDTVYPVPNPFSSGAYYIQL